MTGPLVSVVMAAYNHERYVADAIASVLAQSWGDFELLIADDGSTDRTGDVIAGFSDSRIKVLPSQGNRGACAVLNELVGNARGRYLAVINSDDLWLAGKLAYQVELLEANPEIAASFGRVCYMDRDSRPIAAEALHFGHAFAQDNRSCARWLRHFFDRANCLCHPTLLIRRSCYDDIGRYDNRLRQLPDFDLWIRLVKRHAIHVTERELLRFRIVSGENVSSQGQANAIRTLNEHYLIAQDFFDGVSRELLIEGFGDLLRCKTLPTTAHQEIEQALLYFVPNQWFGRPYQLVGLGKLHGLLASADHRRILRDDYAVDDAWFHQKMAEVDVLRPRFESLLRSGAYLGRDWLRKLHIGSRRQRG